jgi:hypothetical protein
MRKISIPLRYVIAGLGLLATHITPSARATEAIYFTSSQRLPESDEYQYLLSYCTKVVNRFSLSISYAASVKINGSDVSPIVVQLTLSPFGTLPKFLYMTKNAFFSDSVDVKAGTDGLLTSSDAQSSQQIQGILTELGQTAAAVVNAAGGAVLHSLAPTRDKENEPAKEECTTPPAPDEREICSAAIKEKIRYLPFYFDFPRRTAVPVTRKTAVIWLYHGKDKSLRAFPYPPQAKTDTVKSATEIKVTGNVNTADDGHATGDAKITANTTTTKEQKTCPQQSKNYSVAILVNFEASGSQENEVSDEELLDQPHEGFVAYRPHPVRVNLRCAIRDADHPKSGQNYHDVALAPPQTIYPYYDRQWIVPNRDFFTNPKNTHTLNAGFLTGAQVTSQSSAKTVVDTVTSPVRAMMPSVSTSTTVITQPGKPDQVNTTTNVSPPK